jgi:hypothetical protein
MAQSDRTIPANRKQFAVRLKPRWISDRTLRTMIDMHSLLVIQLEPVFGSKRTCDIILGVALRTWP